MPTETQAWVVESKGAPFVLRDITLSDPLADEVLVDGICHTDLLVAAGDLPDGKFPVILGHEGAGYVRAVGAGVTRLKAGDLVLLSYAACEACEACTTGAAYACDSWPDINFGKKRADGYTPVGELRGGEHKGEGGGGGGGEGVGVGGSFFGQSSFARHSLVKASSCVVVPPDTDVRTLAPMGCGLQTGAGGVFNAANLQAHHSVLICGLGGVGIAALFAAVAVGAKTIVAMDVNEERLRLLGATHALNPQTCSVPDEARKLTNGRGVDFAIEATGHPGAARDAFLALGMRGRLVQIGASPAALQITFNDILLGVRSIEVCVEGNDTPHRLVPRLVELHRQGKFPVEKIVTMYNWRDMDKALADMHAGKVIKPVLVYDD